MVEGECAGISSKKEKDDEMSSHMLKNIISFSYIKNKGIRKICILLGTIAVLCYLMMCITKRDVYSGTRNIQLIESQCRHVIEYNQPSSYVMKEHNRNKFYTLTVDYCKFVLKSAPEILRANADIAARPHKIVGISLPDNAVPILYQLPLLWCIVFFYAPFLIVLPFIWVSKGFAESRGEQVKNF